MKKIVTVQYFYQVLLLTILSKVFTSVIYKTEILGNGTVRLCTAPTSDPRGHDGSWKSAAAEVFTPWKWANTVRAPSPLQGPPRH